MIKTYSLKKLLSKDKQNINPYDLNNAGITYLKENLKKLKPKKFTKNPYEPSGLCWS